MRVLAFDPGAERMGVAVVEGDGENPPREIASAVLGLTRASNKGKKEEYQKYRLRLIEMWVDEAPHLFAQHKPDVVVNEILPVVGGGNFVVATQSQLAASAITTVQAMAICHGLPIYQVGATTVKARIGKTKKATKVKVRNGVFEILPSTQRFKKEWTTIFDGSDAFAIALAFLGYGRKK